MPLQQRLLVAALMAASLLIAVPAHCDDISTLKTVMKSATPQEKIKAIRRSLQFRDKSRNKDFQKLLYDVSLNEDEDLGVRYAAMVHQFLLCIVWEARGWESREVMKSEFEATYKDAKSDDVSRTIALAMFLFSKIQADRNIESPPWLSDNDPNQLLVTLCQLLRGATTVDQYKEALPTLLKLLDEDRIRSFVAARCLRVMTMSMFQWKPSECHKLPPGFDLPAPVLVRQLWLWRKSEDHIRLAKAYRAVRAFDAPNDDRELLDPVRTFVDLLGWFHFCNKSEPRDVAAVTALAEVLRDESLSEETRRQAAYFLAHGGSSEVLVNIFAEAPDSTAGKISLQDAWHAPSLLNKIKKNPGPVVARLIEIAVNEGLPIHTRKNAVGVLARMGNEASDALPALKELSLRFPRLPDLTRADDMAEKSYQEGQAHRGRQAFAELVQDTYERIRELAPETVAAGKE